MSKKVVWMGSSKTDLSGFPPRSTKESVVLMKKKFKPVFFDIFPHDEAVALTIKGTILSKILDVYRSRKMSPTQLAKVLKVPQPRVSELMRGKIYSVSIEKLLIYLDKLGVETALKFKTRKAG